MQSNTILMTKQQRLVIICGCNKKKCLKNVLSMVFGIKCDMVWTVGISGVSALI